VRLNLTKRRNVAEQDDRLPSETVPFITAQIIAAALILGPLVFAGIAFVSVQGQPPGDPTLAFIGIGFSAIAIVLSLLVPTVAANQKLRLLRNAGNEISTADLFAVSQTRVIIRAALLEGAAFFCCIAYMVSRSWLALGAAFVLLVLMVVFFPTRGRFDDWVREQRELRALDSASSGSSES
jgi:hypothetical protein